MLYGTIYGGIYVVNIEIRYPHRAAGTRDQVVGQSAERADAEDRSVLRVDDVVV